MKKAFTILELVIVMAVIAILAAVLLPHYATVYDDATSISTIEDEYNSQLNKAQEILNSLKEE